VAETRPPRPGQPEGERRELQQVRLANLHLRSRAAALQEQLRELGARVRVQERELEGVHIKLAAAAEELAAERSQRRRLEAELEKARAEQRRAQTDLAAAGWRVERERRWRAEAEAARLRAVSERHRLVIAQALERVEELAASGEEGVQAAPVEPLEGAVREGEEAPPAALLLARALEMATAEMETEVAAAELAASVGGDVGVLEEAIARAEDMTWDASAVPEVADPLEPTAEVSSQMPVLLAGTAALLNAALHRLRSDQAPTGSSAG
jgi:hypothetical protein